MGIRQALALGPIELESQSLFDFKRAGVVSGWLQATIVVGLFVATVFLTHAEYRSDGTVFGFPGPGFNVLFAPIYEELVFRGWMLGALIRSKRSPLVALAISSVLFGVLHVRNIYWLETATLVRSMVYTGLVFAPIVGYVTLRFRSVWPAVILHYVNNLGFYV